MELKEGYKQTEIGVIPEDWEVKKLGEVADVVGGGTPSSFNSLFWNGDIDWFTPTEIGKHKYVYKSRRKITKEGFSNSSANLLPIGTVLLTSRAGIGDLGILMNESCTNQGFQSLISKENMNPEFLYYLMGTLKNQLLQNASGSTFLEISPGKLKQIEVIIPESIPEQTAIATALSDTDTLIASLEKLIAKKRMIKHGAMQKLLSPKEEWNEIEFPKVCWFQEGPGLRNWQFTKHGIKVINVTNLEKGILNLERTDRHISLEEFQKMYTHFEIDENDIVMASSGNSYGKVAVVRKQDLPLLMNTSVIRFKPIKELVYDYLLIFLNSNHFKNQIDLLITGGAQPNFGPAHLNKIKITLPITQQEQIRISTILSDMDSEIAALETKLEKYKQVKQGMMQKLLTGEIRLLETAQDEKENKTKIIPLQSKEKSNNRHNWEINEAVVISVLTNTFGSKNYPLGRKRYQKLSYLLHRHHERKVVGYRKKAAGPYNPDTRYKGPEAIAVKNKYIERCKKGKFSGFIAAKNFSQAESYFKKWYGQETIQWLEQFRFEKNDKLELWATVDMAVQDLKENGKTVSVESVKKLISNHEEWKPKLERSVFSDENIASAIIKTGNLFGNT